MPGRLRKARRFLAREDGPTTVEYAVMLAMVILVCFVAVQALGTTVQGMFRMASVIAFGRGGDLSNGSQPDGGRH